LFLTCLSFQHFDVFKGFRQRLPGLGGAGEENREGEAALRAARHEEVGPEGDVPVQPVQDQDPGRKGNKQTALLFPILRQHGGSKVVESSIAHTVSWPNSSLAEKSSSLATTGLNELMSVPG